MITAYTIDEIRSKIARPRNRGRSIGFVPTLGALHQGHLSLVKQAKQDNEFVVVSIFVNPAQFGKNEDYKKYPRVLTQDCAILKKCGVDAVFAPSIREMYSADFSTWIEEINLSKYLCGASRPGHFKGVCTIVTKLFNIIAPNKVYFGAKDFQQASIIKKMVRDLNFPIEVIICPIVREPDGLAMSSRNVYLSSSERKTAIALSQGIKLAKDLTNSGCKDAVKIIKLINEFIIEYSGTRIDYIEIVDIETLAPIKKIRSKAVLALAVFVGKTRLIDNDILKLT